jgi:hypothetical protein
MMGFSICGQSFALCVWRKYLTTLRKSYSESKLCCKALVLLVFVLTLSSTKVIAQSIDIQIIGLGINVLAKGEEKKLLLFPGLGVGYDFRKPAIRSGWSFVPMLITATSIQKDSLNTVIFPSIIGRYRFIFQEKFFCDFNIGGGLLIIFHPYASLEYEDKPNLIKVETSYMFAPLISVNFSYSFENKIIVGINITALYDFDSKHILPLVNINFMFPLSNSNTRFYRRR